MTYLKEAIKELCHLYYSTGYLSAKMEVVEFESNTYHEYQALWLKKFQDRCELRSKVESKLESPREDVLEAVRNIIHRVKAHSFSYGTALTMSAMLDDKTEVARYYEKYRVEKEEADEQVACLIKLLEEVLVNKC